MGCRDHLGNSFLLRAHFQICRFLVEIGNRKGKESNCRIANGCQENCEGQKTDEYLVDNQEMEEASTHRFDDQPDTDHRFFGVLSTTKQAAS
ncbi:hypothetical protein BRE01_32900 [Brevibacillus reuszeri]|uniref:Uncharacterized protein n=1 Tax=Brevibacillus reuszeri TaxID=54915 RepID=A0ABQ0TRT6_9BACL|nr:hypothetical protein BRE01_32900 [Brevibacillus reuszeri]